MKQGPNRNRSNVTIKEVRKLGQRQNRNAENEMEPGTIQMHQTLSQASTFVKEREVVTYYCKLLRKTQNYLNIQGVTRQQLSCSEKQSSEDHPAPPRFFKEIDENGAFCPVPRDGLWRTTSFPSLNLDCSINPKAHLVTSSHERVGVFQKSEFGSCLPIDLFNLKRSVLHADLMFPSILNVHIIIHPVNLPIIIQLTN